MKKVTAIALLAADTRGQTGAGVPWIWPWKSVQPRVQLVTVRCRSAITAQLATKKTGINMKIATRWATSALTACALAGCGGGATDSTPAPAFGPVTPASTLSLQTVNGLLAAANSPVPGLQLTCSGSQVAGCYIQAACNSDSDTFSTRMLYGIDGGRITALVVDYGTRNCAGSPTLDPIVRGQWTYTLSSFDAATQTGQIAVSMQYYTDGYVFDANKPVAGVTYASAIDVAPSGGAARLCLSTPLIDPSRPLKFMATTAAPLDQTNCAVQLN